MARRTDGRWGDVDSWIALKGPALDVHRRLKLTNEMNYKITSFYSNIFDESARHSTTLIFKNLLLYVRSIFIAFVNKISILKHALIHSGGVQEFYILNLMLLSKS